MPRRKAKRKWLDLPMTLMGYALLALGLWFTWLGLGVLVHWALPGAEDGERVLEWVRWVTPLGILLYLGLGFSFISIWWWLSGEPIRRWWWRRTGRTGEVDP